MSLTITKTTYNPLLDEVEIEGVVDTEAELDSLPVKDESNAYYAPGSFVYAGVKGAPARVMKPSHEWGEI